MSVPADLYATCLYACMHACIDETYVDSCAHVHTQIFVCLFSRLVHTHREIQTHIYRHVEVLTCIPHIPVLLVQPELFTQNAQSPKLLNPQLSRALAYSLGRRTRPPAHGGREGLGRLCKGAWGSWPRGFQLVGVHGLGGFEKRLNEGIKGSGGVVLRCAHLDHSDLAFVWA